MSFIKNADALARSPLRKDMLALAEAAYASIETEQVLRSSVIVSGNMLTITPPHGKDPSASREFDLSNFDRVFIVGCGKVACQAAAVLENILGSRVTGGAVVGMVANVCDIVSTYKGTHPLPTSANFAASSHMEKIGSEATERDLVIAIIGGGGSAMLCSTEGECDQGQRLYDAFLRSGGTIDELNLVRRHISALKGGGLAKALFPATVVGLIFSDVPGGDPKTVASGPTYKDETTIADAQKVIDRYSLGTYELTETPKEDKYFERVTNILLVSNETALQAIGEKARALGYELIIPECDPYAPCRELVLCMEGAAKPRSAVCLGAEPRLVIPEGGGGSGGRCSFTALEAFDLINEQQVFAAIASDGHDNSEAAGALVDRSTKEAQGAKGVDLAPYRAKCDSDTVLQMTDDLLMTGPVEANVSDLFILLTA